MTINIAVGFALFWGLPHIGSQFGKSAAFSTAVMLAAIQVHHFFVDGVIWRLRNPAVRSPLSSSLRAVSGRAMRRRLLIIALACAGALAVAAPCAAYTPPETNPRIVLDTTRGPILVALVPENSPQHVEQLLLAIADGDLNNSQVARVSPKFYVQVVGALGARQARPVSPSRTTRSATFAPPSACTTGVSRARLPH